MKNGGASRFIYSRMPAQLMPPLPRLATVSSAGLSLLLSPPCVYCSYRTHDFGASGNLSLTQLPSTIEWPTSQTISQVSLKPGLRPDQHMSSFTAQLTTSSDASSCLAVSGLLKALGLSKNS